MKRRCVLLLLSLSVAPGLVQAQDPDFTFSYALQPGGSQTPLFPNEVMTFPDTAVNLTNPTQNQVSSATFVITNIALVSRTVEGITSTSAAFTFSGLPLPPVVLRPNQALTFTVHFRPTQIGSIGGVLRINAGTTVNFNLVGNGVGPVLAYDFTVDTATRTVSPNDTLTLPPSNLGDKSTASMRVRNTGNFEATIRFLASTDASFPLENVPFLPFTLQAGNSMSFKINFTPSLAGTSTARLRIGDISFDLSGVGLGPALTYTAVTGSASAILSSNSAVILTPAPVGFISSAQLQISNTGNAAAFINSISVSGPATGVFTLTNLPALPVMVDRGGTVSFGVAFAPITLGQSAGTLKIDNQSFNLSGVGTSPPPLPGVSFAGANSVVGAAQQVGVGVTLDNSYPIQLNGKLTLKFTPMADVFSDDPAIAFASGGRTINFIVPANSRNALFGLSDSQIRFQTGTVAGTIVLSATFATDAGGINLTAGGIEPATAISVRLSAPRISSVQLAARTASTITLLITGYSPTRSVNTMAFTFAPFVDPNNKDLKLDTTGLTMTVDGPFSVWYHNAASQAFGSLFTATVTFSIRGNVDVIQSVAVTMANSLGTSNSSAVTLR